MTVTATPSPGRRPCARRWTAARAISSSPSTTRPVRSTASTRSPSPSKAKPTACPPLTTASASASTCVEPQPALMLRPSGASAIAVTRAPRRRKASGAARWVAPLAQSSTTSRPPRSRSRKRSVQLAQVVLQRAVEPARAADRGARRRRGVQALLDRLLGRVVELVAVAAEELDPVVGVGVVRGREHHAQVEAVAIDEQRRGGRRQHAGEQRVPAGRGDPGRRGGLEHLARLARVAQDHDLRALGGQQRGRRAGQRQRELRRDLLAGYAANAICSEEPAGHGPATARASASRTAAACAPSSGRPSCAPSRARRA